jgi:hypothetical protein
VPSFGPSIVALTTGLLATIGLASACRDDAASDTTRGTNEALGSIAGRTFGEHALTVAGASFCPSGFGSPDDVTLILSTRADDCDGRRNQTARPDATTLTLHLVQVDGPRTFKVTRGTRGAGEALARFAQTGTDCDATFTKDADEGTIEVAAIDNSSDGFIRGSFDVVFDGERLRGDFDTSVCTIDYFCGQSSECR